MPVLSPSKIGALLFLAVPVFAAEQRTVNSDSVATFHREFRRLTAGPRYVAPLTSLLCTTPSKGLLDTEQKATGPHTRAWVHVYANDAAAGTIAQKSPPFPVGSAIVKEKLAGDFTVAEIGGMIKRAPGYDSANGDWEFFFRSSTGDFQSGKLANCIECHNGAGRDHVFSAWQISSK